MAKPSPRHAGNSSLIAIGRVLRAIRTERGYSQESLANGVELDRSYMGGIERGEHNLTLMSIIKIAEYLDVKPSELLKKAGL